MIQILSLLMITLCCLGQQAPPVSIPKLLWTFWDGDLSISNKQILLKLCLNNMKEYATRSDWQFNLVTYDNLQSYLTPQSYSQCLRLLDNIGVEFKQMRADIIRLELLKDNGGMWVDSSTFFVQKLNWINNIANEDVPIVNRIKSQPDLITFRLDGYDRPNGWVYDDSISKSIHLSPGIENWAIIAKKNTSFVQDSLKVIEEIIFSDEAVLQDKIASSGVVFSQLAQNSYFRFGIYTFQLVMQIKQKELDLLHQRTDINTSDLPRYAVQYYNLWTIECSVMGFNLESITDDILPFLSFSFLATATSTIDQYQIGLRGFVKIGGTKRRYIEMILETIVDPSLCWVVFADSNLLSNQSYFYELMIQNNETPTGLVLRQSIKDSDRDKQRKEELCGLSTDSPQLSYFLTWVKTVFLYVCLYIVFLFLVFFLWIHCNKLVQIHRKLMLVSFIVLITIFFATFHPGTSSEKTCSSFKPGPDLIEFQKSQSYFSSIRERLPSDNGTLFQMMFREHVTKLSDDFSVFLDENSWSFVVFFWKYILGVIMLVSVALMNLLVPKNTLKPMAVGQKRRKMLKAFKLMILLVILVFSLMMLADSFWLTTEVKKSLCYLTQLPLYLTNQRQMNTRPLSSTGMAESEDGTKRVNWMEFVDIFHDSFHKLSTMMVAFQGSFRRKTEDYLPRISQLRESLRASTSKVDQQLSTMLQQKMMMLGKFKFSFLQVRNSLTCQNRIIEAFKLINDNAQNLSVKFKFFLNQFLPLETISFLATGVVVTISLLFCMFILALFASSLKLRQKGRGNYKGQKRTFLVLSSLGFMLSLILTSVVLPNYYFCDFVSTYKKSLEKSSDFFMKILPRTCMAETVSDSLLKRLNDNFDLRRKPFEDYIKLSGQMGQISSYSYKKQMALLEGSSLSKKQQYIQLNKDYNQMLRFYSQSYSTNSQQIKYIFNSSYQVYPIQVLQDAQTMIYQPICVFSFNILYELANYSLYIGFLNLFAFVVTLLLELQKSSFETVQLIEEGEDKKQQDESLYIQEKAMVDRVEEEKHCMKIQKQASKQTFVQNQ